MKGIFLLAVLYSFVSLQLFASENLFVVDTIQPLQNKDSVEKQKSNLTVEIIKKDTVKNGELKKVTNDTIGNIIQEPKTVAEKFDKIIKRNGDSIFCKITSRNLFEVNYLKPGSEKVTKLSTANIKEIFFANGKYVLIDNNPEKKKKDWTVAPAEKEWDNIIVTNNPKDVDDLVEKGPIEALFEAKKMTTNNELMEKNIIVMLKKKAYSMKATTILVVEKNINRMYGELPSIEIKAIAYAKQ
jgi:hypothetical protein